MKDQSKILGSWDGKCHPSGLLAGKKGVIMGVANEHSIAWACATSCLAQGAQVAFSHLGAWQEKRLRELLPPGHTSPVFPCDVRNDEQLSSFFLNVRECFGEIDFLIHSIAFTDRECLRNPISKTSRAHFALTMDISAYSLIATSREAAALMPNGGSIISMTYYGSEKVIPRYNVMGVAKAALESASRYLADDLGSKGIRVNCISAGPISTLSANAIPGLQHMLDVTARHAPLKRNITSEEVGRTALFLASDLSSGISGENIHVDAGFHTLGLTSPVD